MMEYSIENDHNQSSKINQSCAQLYFYLRLRIVISNFVTLVIQEMRFKQNINILSLIIEYFKWNCILGVPVVFDVR